MKERIKKWLNLLISIVLLVLVIVTISYNIKGYETKNEIVEVQVTKCEEKLRGTVERYRVIENGRYKSGNIIKQESIYKIYFNINEEEYYVSREEPFKVGDSIFVKEKITIYDEKEISREYR